MPSPAEKLEEMLVRFERDEPRAGTNLRDLITTTPELKSRMLTAVEAGNLDKFKPLDPTLRVRGVMGGFDASDDSIAVPMDVLEASKNDPRKANTLRMVFGHEIEHSINKEHIARSADQLGQEVSRIAGSPSPHDYTPVLSNYNERQRERESNDQIAGFNVLAAHVRRQNPNAAPEQLNAKLYASADQMRQYFDVGLDVNGQRTFAPKSGLTIGANGQIATTPDNVEAFGKYFYDHNRYPEVYAHRNLALAHKAESDAAHADPGRPTPQIRVDLQSLKLPGFPLPPGFADSSRGIAVPAPQQAPSPTGPARSRSIESGGAPAGETNPREHAYFQMLRDRLPEQVPDHAVAHAMLLAKRGGLEADQVDPGRVGLHQGKIWIGGTTPGFHISVDPAQAPAMEQVQRELHALSSPQAPTPAANAEELQPPSGRVR